MRAEAGMSRSMIKLAFVWHRMILMAAADKFAEADTERRAEAAIKKMLAAPPKPFTPKASPKDKPRGAK